MNLWWWDPSLHWLNLDYFHPHPLSLKCIQSLVEVAKCQQTNRVFHGYFLLHSNEQNSWLQWELFLVIKRSPNTSRHRVWPGIMYEHYLFDRQTGCYARDTAALCPRPIRGRMHQCSESRGSQNHIGVCSVAKSLKWLSSLHTGEHWRYVFSWAAVHKIRAMHTARSYMLSDSLQIT